MPWNGLLNHEAQIERFRRAVAQNRLGHTYLFVGKSGIGKRLFALKLAEALLCEQPGGNLEACGHCPACQQVQSESHPDLILVSKPSNKAALSIEHFVGVREHRRQEGLVHDIGLKPFRGGRKIAIIDDADYLNQESANSLLKTLEEPPPQSVLILISSSEHTQLRTIVSRSQVVRFSPLSKENVRKILEQSEIETGISLDALAAASEGSLDRAFRLADSDLFEFREQLYHQLASGDPGQQNFTKTMTHFVDAAGSESAVKRDRLDFLADLAISFFRIAYLQLTGLPEFSNCDEKLRELASQFAQRLQARANVNDLAVCAESIERTLELQFHVSANVAAANAIDDWLIQLGRIFRGSEPVKS
jgi:DNA polymerase III subunit delta'